MSFVLNLAQAAEPNTAAYSPCNHRSCDTASNIDDTALDGDSDAIGYAVRTLSAAG